MGAPFGDAYLRHLRHPSRAGTWPDGTPDVATGEASDPEGTHEARRVRLQLRGSAAGPIEDARFQAFGCSATLACASFVADAVVGRDAAAAATLAPEDVIRALEVPRERASAAELAVRALRAALARRSARGSARSALPSREGSRADGSRPRPGD